GRAAPGHPLLVAPRVSRQTPSFGRGFRPDFTGEGIGIGFIDAIIVVLRRDRVLVQNADADAGDEAFPDAGRPYGVHPGLVPAPLVKRADHADAAGVGRPNGELRAGDAVAFGDVGAE